MRNDETKLSNLMESLKILTNKTGMEHDFLEVRAFTFLAIARRTIISESMVRKSRTERVGRCRA